MDFWKKLSKYMPIIGILLFIFIIWKIGVDELFNSIIKINLLYLFIVLILFIPIALLQIFKWKYIVNNLQGIKFSFFNAMKFHFVSSFLGSITPGRIGLLSRIFFLKKTTDKHIGYCASSVILDKTLDFFVLFVFGLVGVLFLLKNQHLYITISTALIIFIIGIIFLFSRKLTVFFLKYFYRYFIPKKFKETLKLTFHNFYESMPSPKQVIIPLFLTLICWLFVYLQSWILLLGFNVHIPYTAFIFIYPLVTLATLLPVTIFGIGTRELSLIALFSKYNVNNSGLVAFSITGLFLNTAILFITYMLYSRKVKLENEQLN